MRLAFTKYDLEAASAITRSRSRREKARRQRRWTRLLLAAAAAGAICLAFFVTAPDPGPRWYLGLLGILLIVPYLVWRLD